MKAYKCDICGKYCDYSHNIYGNIMVHRHPQNPCHCLLQKGNTAIMVSIVQPLGLLHARYLRQGIARYADNPHRAVLMAEAEQKEIIRLLPRP